MQMNQLAQYISLQVPAAWEHCYSEAMEHYRAGWLDELDFEYILDYYRFSEDYYKPRLRRELELLKRDGSLNRACWLMHYILFYAQDKEDFLNTWGWKGTPKAFAEHGSPVTCVVAQLAGQSIHEKNMADRGYDDEQIDIHKNGVRGCWVGQHEVYGIDGVGFGHMLWGAYFMKCHLVRIGRLQYESGLKHFGTYDHLFDKEPVYIYIHIPSADNGLQDDEVEQSVHMALERLERYYPEVKDKQVVFCTHTWLLSPELREILKPESNIVKFQNRFQITEFDESVGPFLSFGFKVTPGPDVDYNALPEDTHLRREIKKRLINGEKLHQGFGYFTV